MIEEAQRLKGEADAAMVAHDNAVAEARIRAQTLANEGRAKATADAETHRKDADAKLELRVAEAEKAIAAARSAAMTNVHGIAEEAARAIVERLIGRAPANEDVTEAVRDVLKG